MVSSRQLKCENKGKDAQKVSELYLIYVKCQTGGNLNIWPCKL